MSNEDLKPAESKEIGKELRERALKMNPQQAYEAAMEQLDTWTAEQEALLVSNPKDETLQHNNRMAPFYKKYPDSFMRDVMIKKVAGERQAHAHGHLQATMYMQPRISDAEFSQLQQEWLDATDQKVAYQIIEEKVQIVMLQQEMNKLLEDAGLQ